MNAVTAERVEAALRAALQPTALEVLDDSHLHAGHAGAKEGRHFTVRVTSHAFTGLSLVARHRLVYDALCMMLCVCSSRRVFTRWPSKPAPRRAIL